MICQSFIHYFDFIDQVLIISNHYQSFIIKETSYMHVYRNPWRLKISERATFNCIYWPFTKKKEKERIWKMNIKQLWMSKMTKLLNILINNVNEFKIYFCRGKKLSHSHIEKNKDVITNIIMLLLLIFNRAFSVQLACRTSPQQKEFSHILKLNMQMISLTTMTVQIKGYDIIIVFILI